MFLAHAQSGLDRFFDPNAPSMHLAGSFAAHTAQHKLVHIQIILPMNRKEKLFLFAFLFPHGLNGIEPPLRL
jgi:hypothetical protein